MKRIIFLLAVILVVCARSFSQVQGDITDPKDKGIPNAMIIAIDSAKKTADTVKSDSRGFYSFDNLKPGIYKIEVKATGFRFVALENIIVKPEDIGLHDEDMYAGQRLDIMLSLSKSP